MGSYQNTLWKICWIIIFTIFIVGISIASLYVDIFYRLPLDTIINGNINTRPFEKPAKEFVIPAIDFDKLPMRMSKLDKMLFAQMILTLTDLPNNQKKRYLEWGSGGSTQVISILTTNINAKYFSIEHAPQWCDKMLTDSVIQLAITTGKLHYECIDTKQPLAAWGHPTNESNISAMTGYVDAIDSFNEPLYNIVLIDGRFRVECAYKLLLGSYVNYDSIIMMHDYYNRNHFHQIETYYEIINETKAKTDILGVFKVKKGYFENKTLKQQLKNDFIKNRLNAH